MRPKVKICGLTRAEDAVLAARLGADYLGLNFWPGSRRCVGVRRGREIAAAVAAAMPSPPQLVGIFVNQSRAEIEDVAASVGLDRVQFHGDETAAEVAPFADRAIKAVRVAERAGPGALAGWDAVWAMLVDTARPGAWGGTGESWDFASLAARRHPRTFIAGGLRPQTVRAAVGAARPWGVDLCSGVESRPGEKDPELLRRLFEEIDDGQSPPAA